MNGSALSGARELAKMLAAGGVRTDPLAAAPSVDDIRKLARRRLPKMAFDIVDGAADAEYTADENITDLRQVRFRPRWLTDISKVDTRTTVAGLQLNRPYVFGPLGLMRTVGGDGELSAVRAAGKAGIPFTISTASNWSIEEIAEAATGPLWFQLYMYKSDSIVNNLLDRARAAGAQALAITVDLPLNGKRRRDYRNGMSIPPKITPQNALSALRHPGWLLSVSRPPAIGFRNLVGEITGSSAMTHNEFVNKHLTNLTLTWESIREVRRRWDGPLMLKGILTPEDARKAHEVGADGIYVSNHGGRQLDSSPSSISVLPEIVDAVGDKMDVLFDGGIRTGGDIAKALAVGADAVSVGRAWAYGNAAAGERGVARVIELLDSELEQTLGLLGCPTVTELDRTFVTYPLAWHGQGVHREPVPDRAYERVEGE